MHHVRICLVIALLCPLTGRAETCPAIAQGTPELAGMDALGRLEFIHQSLRFDEQNEQTWRTAWLAFLIVADAGELGGAIAGTVAPNPPRQSVTSFGWFLLTLLRADQAGLYTGVITATGGIGSVFFRTANTAFDGDRLDRLIKANSGKSPCALLAEAERLLLLDAHDEAFAHSFVPHVVSAAVSVTALLVLGLVFHKWGSAAINAGLGLAGGELLIATEPRDAEASLAKYRLGDLTLPPPPGVHVEVSGTSVALKF